MLMYWDIQNPPSASSGYKGLYTGLYTRACLVKKFAWVFYNFLQKNSYELFGQPNTLQTLVFIFSFYVIPEWKQQPPD